MFIVKLKTSIKNLSNIEEKIFTNKLIEFNISILNYLTPLLFNIVERLFLRDSFLKII